MKKKNTNPKEIKTPAGKLMTRKQAIKKSGYMALSAATMMMLLPTQGQAQASPKPAAPTNNSTNNQKGIWDD